MENATRRECAFVMQNRYNFVMNESIGIQKVIMRRYKFLNRAHLIRCQTSPSEGGMI
jgi:predicted transcriptional regulator